MCGKEFFMWHMFWPIGVVVAANTIYNICAKSTPANINAFASLFLTYSTAAVCSVLMFFLTSGQKHFGLELAKANWTSFVLGFAIIGLEFGSLYIYRVGWKISLGNLTASIALACVLVVVGVLLYRETLTLRQVIGMCVCGLGLFLIQK
jgi:drug/metabolite transporter (DMT)-like permease